jgi:predicted metalloprotease with PDZ domain
MTLGALVDVADRQVDAPVLFYEGPAVSDHSMLRFAFAPPGARKSKTPSWQDPSHGTVLALDQAKQKLVLAVDLLDVLFAPGRHPPDVGFSIALEDGVFSLRKVPKGGAGDKAGLRVGDVITTMNGRRIAGPADYIEGRRELAEKRRISLGIERGGKKIKTELVAS